MPLSSFHPAVASWFSDTLGTPTKAQACGWEAIRAGRNTLIAAPTGSGKTLAAFLTAIDGLLCEGLAKGGLPDETRVVYVSPLKALSTDIHKNLAEPLTGVRKLAGDMGLGAPDITTAVRTGDTPASKRAAMLKAPPHILVTTPESLYLMLTAARSREILRTVRTVIVDEIHAVIDSRRGSHLSLSLERLRHVTGGNPLRIGLSATQKPVEDVARFLVGSHRLDPQGNPDCVVVDEGHQRHIDLALEMPGSPLEAVMSAEVYEETYDRLAELIRAHKTTLVFVNTRRQAERVAKHLSDRLGETAVMPHHGSLSKEKRLDAETRLKNGQLEALVATASLELGIDIGHIDLVCQLGSTHSISTFLQRAGRSGHTVSGTPKGRLFPLSRDDLVECTALLRAVRRGELDRLILHERPLDVLAQQIVAESACEDWDEKQLYELCRSAYPYRALSRDEFDRVVQMLALGYATKRGRRGALVHYDGVNGRLRGRRGARMLAITAGGAIPDVADYRVVLEPEQTFLGTINEDFAIESMAGDIFQLGNASWRILQIQSGTVRVADAHGEPPNIPFWLGEAPSRTAELSAAVSELRRDLDQRVDEPNAATDWLQTTCGIPQSAAFQLVAYLKDTKHLLGVIPSQETLVLERFFDESGGMQLVLHSPFGSRLNRAWGLALRKRFCRQFNFELQAAATEDALLLSLGPQHSFPLEDVFRYLNPKSVRTVLIQALLDAPMFQTRWRWVSTLSLAVPRRRSGKKVPSPLQRMEAEDLMAAVFPDAAACLENIGGDRDIPDHPLVRQTIHDCLTEAMDLDNLTRVLSAIQDNSVRCVSRDTPEPSPLAHEILNARPYAFLDDAPLEERRTQAVYTRRAFDPSDANELGALDQQAIARVAEEAWPDIRDADELHDALLTAGYLCEVEGLGASGESWQPLFLELADAGRAATVTTLTDEGNTNFWVATEQLHHFRSVHPNASVTPAIDPVDELVARDEALREIVRGRMELLGPTTAPMLATSLRVDPADIEAALHALESEGVILRGHFTPNSATKEWCNRRLLARIHRYTLNRLRAEIEPVTAAVFMRYLFSWQKVDPEHRVAGVEGLAVALEQLDGYELAAGAWESDVLSARMRDYDPMLLDTLCLSGRVSWGRLSPPTRPGAGPLTTGPIRSTPVSLFLRSHAHSWLALAPSQGAITLSSNARSVLGVLEERGASFFQEIASASKLLATHLEVALGELVALGLVTSDSYAGLRVLLTPSERRRPPRGGVRRRHRTVPFGVESAGRWSIMRPLADTSADDSKTLGRQEREEMVEDQAWTLLRRYGIVFRRLLARETNLAHWRELVLVYRRLEARGELRGGRFVSGMSGEQFALPEAVGMLRSIRRQEPTGEIFGVSAADPLNLTGIITPEARVSALANNRVAYRDGIPVAAMESDRTRVLIECDNTERRAIEQALIRRRLSPTLRAYLGRAG